MEKKAIIKKSFAMVQWHGEDYIYYEEDVEQSTFEVGSEVLVLREAKPSPMGKLYVVYSEDKNEATVVFEDFLEFI